MFRCNHTVRLCNALPCRLHPLKCTKVLHHVRAKIEEEDAKGIEMRDAEGIQNVNKYVVTYQCSGDTSRCRGAVMLIKGVSATAVLMRKNAQTHYEMLEVAQSATKAQIHEAFIRLSKQLHPDLNHLDPDCKDKFLQLQDAYTVLSSTELRQEYDTSLQKARVHSRLHTGSSDFTRPYRPNQSYYRTHEKQRPNQEYSQSTDKEDTRSFFEKLLDRFLDMSDPQRSPDDADERSSFHKLLEVLHRSTVSRPTAAFLSAVGLGFLAYAFISIVLVFWSLQKGARTEIQHEKMNMAITEQRRLQESASSNSRS